MHVCVAYFINIAELRNKNSVRRLSSILHLSSQLKNIQENLKTKGKKPSVNMFSKYCKSHVSIFF